MARALMTLLLVMVIGLSTGCTTPSSGGTASARDAVAFRVYNQPVTVQELIALPEIRFTLREYLFRMAIQHAADEMGLKPNEAEIEKQFQQEKQSIIDAGSAWGDWLQAAGFTEDEIREKLVTRDLMTQYMRIKLNLTDEQLKEAWDQDQAKFISTYASLHRLTAAEQSTLTFEQLKDFIRETIEPMKLEEIRPKESLALIDSIALDLSSSFKDPAMAKLYEDLIINFQKSPYRPDAAAQPGAPDGEAGSALSSGGAGVAAPPPADVPPATDGPGADQPGTTPGPDQPEAPPAK